VRRGRVEHLGQDLDDERLRPARQRTLQDAACGHEEASFHTNKASRQERASERHGDREGSAALNQGSLLSDFTPNGTIDPTMPILMFAIMFGLSMDYEVFLLSRIRERYDITGDNTAAVAGGLQRTGGLITSLALLLVIVVGAFSASGITFIKLLGVGMIVALILDATVVRVLLVPAVMRLLGDANWWAPRPLRRLYARYGIREADPAPADASPAPQVSASATAP
jgi:hypothetical protein